MGSLGLSLNWLDYIFFILIAASVIISFMRGFLRELCSLITWIVAFLVTFNLSDDVSHYLKFISSSPTIRLIVAFIGLFFLIWVIGAFVNMFVVRLIRFTPFRSLDRVLGIGFGLARGFLIVFMLIVLGEMTVLDDGSSWTNSKLAKTIAPIAKSVAKSFRKTQTDNGGDNPITSDLKQRLIKLHEDSIRDEV